MKNGKSISVKDLIWTQLGEIFDLANDLIDFLSRRFYKLEKHIRSKLPVAS